MRDTPWIPVRHLDGSRAIRSTLEVLREAHTIQFVDTSDALLRLGVLRFLLALVYDTHSVHRLEQQQKLLDQGRLDARRLENHPFPDARTLYQYPASVFGNMKPNTISRLIPHHASGNNAVLEDERQDDQPVGLPFNEALGQLIAHQATAIGGGRSLFGYTLHAPTATAAHFVLQGRNLFETLVLNLLPTREHDRPSWTLERTPVEDLTAGIEVPVLGFAHQHSWVSRAVHLLEEEGEVKQVLYAQGNRPHSDKDPFVAYLTLKDGVVTTLKVDHERHAWNYAQALLNPAENLTLPLVLQNLRELQLDFPVQVEVTGIDADKAKIFEVVQVSFPLTRGMESFLLAAQDAANTLLVALMVLMEYQRYGQAQSPLKADQKRMYAQKHPLFTEFTAWVQGTFELLAGGEITLGEAMEQLQVQARETRRRIPTLVPGARKLISGQAHAAAIMQKAIRALRSDPSGALQGDASE